MTLKIAIVDEDLEFMNSMQVIASDYLANKKIKFEITLFPHPHLLMLELSEGTYYDLFLLETEMKNGKMNGLDISRSIRKTNQKAFIIFVTLNMAYIFESFKVTAFRYILKYEMEQKLLEALEAISDNMAARAGEFYAIETITTYIKLYYSNIFYIYKSGKYAVLVYSFGEYKVRKSLSTVYRELNSDEFIFIERGYIVNIAYVNRMENQKIYLYGDVSLAVSRQQMHLVKDKIAGYRGNHL